MGNNCKVGNLKIDNASWGLKCLDNNKESEKKSKYLQLDNKLNIVLELMKKYNKIAATKLVL
jgi:hypothetical protein